MVLTHLIFTTHRQERVLVAYYTLANKSIVIPQKSFGKFGKTLQGRIKCHATYDETLGTYSIPAPLVAQLGKNFYNNYNNLISGRELLELALNQLRKSQIIMGGKFIYLECEDKPKLVEFYENNGFIEYDKRALDRDETNLEGDYLVQMMRYLK